MNIEEYKRPPGIHSKAQWIGLELLAKADITPKGDGIWMLSSPDSTAPMILNFADQREFCSTPGTCSCDAFRKSRPPVACVHLWALLFNFQPPTPEELSPTLTALPMPVSVAQTVPDIEMQAPMPGLFLEAATRGGYSRFGKKYNEAVGEAIWRTLFLGDAVFQGLAPSPNWHLQKTQGRHRIPFHRVMYGLLARALLKTSYRGAAGWMNTCAEIGVPNFERNPPQFDMLSKANRDELMTDVVTELLRVTSRPMQGFGKVRIGADGTGFGTNAKADWMNEGKYGRRGSRPAKWYRANIMWDLDGLAIIAATVTDVKGDKTGEQTEAFKLVDAVKAAGWEVDWAACDAGYHSAKFRDAIVERLNADPYIPYHRNSKNALPNKKEIRDQIIHSDVLERMYHMYKSGDGTFREKYRMRVKAECGNHTLKKMFGDSVSTFGDRAKINETLWKCVGHNMRMLQYVATIHEINLNDLLKK